ncbi:MAG: HIT family protein [Candidatus Yanofskybacteria bacterium]|nr:HIT family protein [Candidatus Yanofskybacteria bacterium]
MSKKEKPFVQMEHARLPEQAKVMERIQAEGYCPFCRENLAKNHKPPILREGSHWLITLNQWPYENTRIHLLAIHRFHVEKLGDLSSEAWRDLGNLVAWAEREYQVDGGAIGMRFGDPARNGGTVRHLHLQLLTANITDKTDPNYKPVRFRAG